MASGYVKAECGMNEPATLAEKLVEGTLVLACWLIGLAQIVGGAGLLVHWFAG